MVFKHHIVVREICLKSGVGYFEGNHTPLRIRHTDMQEEEFVLSQYTSQHDIVPKWGIITHSVSDKVLMHSLSLKGTLENCIKQIETAK